MALDGIPPIALDIELLNTRTAQVVQVMDQDNTTAVYRPQEMITEAS